MFKKTFRKALALFMVLLMAVSVTAMLGGCSPKDGNYPVTVGQTVLREKPEKVAVMSDNLADIIYYMGFSTQICAISDACTQETLTKYIESVGDETTPNTDAIINSGATLVLTDTPLSTVAKDKLESEGIEVMNLMMPSTIEQLQTVYITLGTIFGGNESGRQTGADSFKRLLTTLEQAEKEVDSSTMVKLVCYLYLNENNALCSFSSSTCEGMILSYVSATNVASNFPEEKVDEDILRLSNPDFIFYENEEVLKYLQKSPSLSGMNALKTNQTYILPKQSLQRMGTTLIDTQSFMLSRMFPQSVSQNTTGESLAERYGITLTEDMSYKAGDDHENIKAVQQRLIDLKYLVLPEGDGATTYFGSMTEQAVKDFQSANGIEPSGVADYATLSTMFLSTTLSAEGQPVVPQGSDNAPTEPDSAPTEATTPDNPDNPDTPDTPDVNTNGYNIDLSSSKTYQAGDEHEDIKAIQQRLEELLYISFGEGDSYTSYYGAGTERAVMNFQESNGLVPTGIADYDTLKLLFSDNALKPQ